jgi:serine/threonine protein phosphatase PrpC
MIQHNFGSALGLRTVNTQVDIEGVPAEETEALIRGILSAHVGQLVTLRHGAQPLVTLSVDEISSHRDLGLVYHVTTYKTPKEKAAVTYLDPRGLHPLDETISYLPSGAWCLVHKRISDLRFRLPQLGDIERGSHCAWQVKNPYALLNDAERITINQASHTSPFSHAHLGIGAGKRVNEDAILLKQLSDHSHLITVADGIGGRGAGLLAARIVTSAFAHHVSSPSSFHLTNSFLQHDFQSVFTDISQRYPLLTSTRMGAACAAVRVGDTSFEYIHSGDCRIGHFRSSQRRTRCLWQTDDQVTPKGRPINVVCLEKGQIQSLNLPVRSRRVAHGDTIVIGSDGFWRSITTKDLERILHSHPTPAAAGEHLGKLIDQRMSRQRDLRDNYSFVIHRHQINT